MSKTLVIILAETRAHELTFDSFKKNVYDELNADLCVCIGVKSDYDYENPFYKLAKYKFLYEEQHDFGEAFDRAYDEISKTRSECEKIDYSHSIFDINNNEIYEPDVTIYKKPLHWREFLKIKDQFMGGIKDNYHEHQGSASILIFFRWFLLKNLIESDVINQYDRFVITRSDYLYKLPHPSLSLMDKNNIWIPNNEYYGGITDRHVILSKSNIENYLNILNNMVLKSNQYFMNMNICNRNDWNLERLIAFHLNQNNVLHSVREFPFIMYSVRNINGTTRWTEGNFSEELGYFIKYGNEYNSANLYKNDFEKSGLTIDDFYEKIIYKINKKIKIRAKYIEYYKTAKNRIPNVYDKKYTKKRIIHESKSKTIKIKTIIHSENFFPNKIEKLTQEES